MSLFLDDVLSAIDLELYPITNLNEPACVSLIQKCQDELSSIGSVLLPGFVKGDVIKQMAAEVENLPSYNRLEIVNCYGTEAVKLREKELSRNGELNATHPLSRMFTQDVHAVAADCIPAEALIQQVYNSKVVAAFLARILKIPVLYKFADEFQSLNIMYIHNGGHRTWHFDGSEFVVTLMLQPSLVGGEFEFSPFVRGAASETDSSERDECYSEVQKVLEGEHAAPYQTRLVQLEAGTLSLFFGNRSLHRVRTVFGPQTRIQSVLSYHTNTSDVGLPSKNVSLYGKRVADIYDGRGLHY